MFVVDCIGVADIQRLVHGQGVARFIERLAGEIEADYARWAEFEKSARVASHSDVGVIELMPTSDGHFYSFKYVNGHPTNTAAGLLTVTAFGVLADVATGTPDSSAMSLRIVTMSLPATVRADSMAATTERTSPATIGRW